MKLFKRILAISALPLLVAVLVLASLHQKIPQLVGPKPLMAAEASSQEASRPLANVDDLNRAFVELAKDVNPKVVTVFTEKVYRIDPRFGSPFTGSPFEDFFGQFFGQSPHGRPSPEPREFRQAGLGSGVIVSSDGLILTNNHVVADADTINVRLMDNKVMPAKVLGADPQTDIAVLKVDGLKAEPIKLGNSDQLQVGEWVLAIGSPLSPNLAHTVTSGIVSAKGRSNVGLAEYEDFIQTDAAINPGNSGGALINLHGELVGINTAIMSRSGGNQGIGFAVPVNMARHVMDSIVKQGKVIRGWLGVYIQDVDQNLAKGMNLNSINGALVSDVVADGPAKKAGIESGDFILKLDGKDVSNATELRNSIAEKAPGTKVSLEIQRDGKEKDIEVKLGELKPEVAASGSSADLEELLGFQAAPFTEDQARAYDLDRTLNGVVVVSVTPGSAAQRAGLREGDLIVSVNRASVGNMDEFRERIAGLKKGDNLFVRLVRGQRIFYLAYTL